MNATANKSPAKKPATGKAKFVARAMGGFMVIKNLDLHRWAGIVKVEKASVDAAIASGADPEVIHSTARLLGTQHHKLRAVNSLYVRIYTFMDQRWNAIRINRGEYLVPVAKVPEVWCRLKELKAEADKARDKFISEYLRLVKIAAADMGDLLPEVKDRYPSESELRTMIGIDLSTPPQPLAVNDMSRVNLPAEYAAEFAGMDTDNLQSQLEEAKRLTLEEAQKQIDAIIRQLDGGRLSEEVIDRVQRMSAMLRGMVTGYDNDPRLIALADLIDEKVLNVKKREEWKSVPAKRAESLTAARTVQKGLKDYQKAAPAPAANKSASKPAAPKASKVVARGIMGKKLAKGKAKASA